MTWSIGYQPRIHKSGGILDRALRPYIACSTPHQRSPGVDEKHFFDPKAIYFDFIGPQQGEEHFFDPSAITLPYQPSTLQTRRRAFLWPVGHYFALSTLNEAKGISLTRRPLLCPISPQWGLKKHFYDPKAITLLYQCSSRWKAFLWPGGHYFALSTLNNERLSYPGYLGCLVSWEVLR